MVMRNNKQKIILIILVSLIVSSMIFSITNVSGRPGRGIINGYIRNGNGTGINNVLVEAYIGSFKEDEDLTDTSGRYDIDIGFIFSKTYVTLKFTPLHNYKAKQVSVSVYPDVTKRKDVTLTQFFALLIALGIQRSYSGDVLLMQDVLIDHYNFDSNGNNIYLLTAFDKPERDRETTIDNINWATGQIASKSSAIDYVLVFISGHGNAGVIIVGRDEVEMSASDLDTTLDVITCKFMYIFINTCLSGSLGVPLSEDNRAIYTATDEDSSTGGDGAADNTFWGGNIIFAFTPGSGDKELAEEADTNNNFKVSIYEAYVQAKAVIDSIYPAMNPLRFPGDGLGSGDYPDANHYIGDESYL